MIVTSIYIEVESEQPDLGFTADTTLETADDTYHTADETLISTGVAGIDYQRIELFTDEQITMNSSIKNYNDLSKLFADFTKAFTIPASTKNNIIFKHWYESSVGETNVDFPVNLVEGTAFDHRKTYNGYIEVDTLPFKYGKFTMQKANIKNGVVDSYSINFTGSIIQLTDKFKDYKLNSLLGWEAYNIAYNWATVGDRIRNTSYSLFDIHFPLLGNEHEYEYLTGGTNDITLNSGAILWSDLFPSIKLKRILELIQSNYGLTFTGSFFNSARIANAELLLKNAEKMSYKSALKKLQFKNEAGVPTDVIRYAYQETFINPNPPFNTLNVIRQAVNLQILTSSTNYNVYVYNNGQLYFSRLNKSGNYYLNIINKTGYFDEVYNFEIYVDSDVPVTVIFEPDAWKSFLVATGNPPPNQSTYLNYYYIGFPNVQQTNSDLRIVKYVPDITINDFLTGLIKMHNLMIIPKSENEFEFVQLENWYDRGELKDISKFISDEAIEVNKPNMFKKIDFKYEKSENFSNNIYYTTLNKYYGDLFYENEQSAFTETYEVKLPFENVMWKKSIDGENFFTTTFLDKNASPYTPKPIIIYNNGIETVSTAYKFTPDNITFPSYTTYRRFSNELAIAGTDYTYIHTANWGAEFSSWYDLNVPNGLYYDFYSKYIENLYNQRTRVVKCKGIFNPDFIANIKLNDRIVLSNKRYVINNLEINLTTGEVDFELINDFRPITGLNGNRYSNLPSLIVDNTAQVIEYMLYISDYDTFDVKAPSGYSTYSTSTGNAEDILLTVSIPANGSGLDRSDVVNLEYFKDGISTIIELPIFQTL